MRWRAFAAIAIMGSVPACQAEQAPPSAARPLTKDQLTRALLTVTDLPAGFVADTVRGSPPRGAAPTADCAERFSSIETSAGEGRVAAAEARFKGAGSTAGLRQGLSSYETSEQAAKRVTDLANVLSECPTFSANDQRGDKVSYEVSTLSFPKIGDDDVAVTLRLRSPTGASEVNVVAFRVGSSFALISHGGASPRPTVLQQAATAAAAKLSAAGDAAG